MFSTRPFRLAMLEMDIHFEPEWISTGTLVRRPPLLPSFVLLLSPTIQGGLRLAPVPYLARFIRALQIDNFQIIQNIIVHPEKHPIRADILSALWMCLIKQMYILQMAKLTAVLKCHLMLNFSYLKYSPYFTYLF